MKALAVWNVTCYGFNEQEARVQHFTVAAETMKQAAIAAEEAMPVICEWMLEERLTLSIQRIEKSCRTVYVYSED